MMSSQGVVFAAAAAAAAVSGTAFLLALRLQKSIQFPLPRDHHHSSPPIILRSCISSTSDEKNKNKKKRVHFAEDVVVSSRARRDGREERIRNYRESSSETKVGRSCSNGGIEENRGMPENRVALYNGILRDRVAHRLAYSY